MKKFFVPMLAVVLALVMAMVVQAEIRVNIVLDGTLRNLQHGAAIIDNVPMIDAEDLINLLGGTLQTTENTVRLESRGMLFRGYVGQREVLANQNWVQASSAPMVRNGRIWVPLQDAAEALNITANWEPDLRLMRLTTRPMRYALPFARPPAREDAISYADAIARMNEQNTTLITITENIILLEREQRALDDIIYELEITESRNNENTMMEVRLLRLRRQIQNQFRIFDVNEQIISDSNEIQLRNMLANRERIALDIRQLEESIYFEQRALLLALLRYDLGLESDAEIRALTNSIERSKINLENLLISREDNRVALNLLLGFEPEVFLYIDGIEPISFAELNLARQIAHAQENAPTVQLRLIELDTATFMYRSYTVMLREESQAPDYIYEDRRGREHTQDSSILIQLRNDVNAATRALEDTRDGLERNLRSTYSSLRQLEENRNSAMLELERALQEHDDAIIRYLSGVSTYFEVSRTRLAIISAEITLKRIEINFDMLYFQFNNPHLN